MPMRSAVLYRLLFASTLIAGGMAGACDDRQSCDQALAVVCACDSHPCEMDPPPDVVRALRRCDESDARPSSATGDITVCIQDKGRDFCGVLDGVVTTSQSICSADCDASCTSDLTTACHQMQYATCDLP